MGIMTGNEESWLRMMLDDANMVESMGLPPQMTEEQKDEVIGMMLGDENFMGEFHRQDEKAAEELKSIFTEKEEDESPCDWMVREAMNELGIDTTEDTFTVGMEVTGNDLETTNYYLITFPNGKEATVRLNKILTNSLGNDYIFENIKGAEDLTSKSNSSMVASNEFPLPKQLLSMTKFNLLTRD